MLRSKLNKFPQLNIINLFLIDNKMHLVNNNVDLIKFTIPIRKLKNKNCCSHANATRLMI